MTASNQIQMNSMPSTPPLLLRAAVTRKSPSKAPVFPDTVISVDACSISESDLQRYRRACGFRPDADHLPMSYLHILAFRLQMSMMLRKDFPLTPMGCIHLSNTLRQYRPVDPTEKISMQCRLGESQLTDKGVEFRFICSAYVGQDKVWQDDSLYLSRMKTGIKANKGPRPVTKAFAHCTQWQISPAQARRYAMASGDFNPIHLHNISAKILGFKRMVIHGMWSQAACIAALDEHIHERMECHAEFKTPVFLPATVQFCHESDDRGLNFALRSADGQKPHLSGYLRAMK